MRAARFVDPSGAERIGRLDETPVVDAGPAGPGGFVPSAEGWEGVAGASGPEFALADVRLLHPVEPAKLIGIGLNYRDHARSRSSTCRRCRSSSRCGPRR